MFGRMKIALAIDVVEERLLMRSVRFTRRTATVTISVPDAACASAITACDGYLPVPTIRRDRKVRSGDDEWV